LETVPGSSQYANIYSKWLWQTDLTIEIGLTGGNLRVNWGYSASAAEFWDAFSVQAGRWYHLAVVIDGVNKVRKVRRYDATAGTVANYSSTPNNQLRVGAANTTIGALANPGNYLDGKLDETVIFNDLLSDIEIDAIRNGVFPPDPLIKVFQEVAQVEYSDPPLFKVFQVTGQVEYQDAQPGINVSQIIGQVEYDEFSGLKISQIVGQVEYSDIPLPRRIFPVSDSRTLWQSQVEKRTFPVVA
jgi:hypothetical protein